MEEPGISSAFQLNLQPKYSAGDPRSLLWKVRMGKEMRACMCTSRFVSSSLSRSRAVWAPLYLPLPPLLPRASFPAPPSLPAAASLDFVSDFPRKGLHGGHGVKNTAFLMHSLGKQAGTTLAHPLCVLAGHAASSTCRSSHFSFSFYSFYTLQRNHDNVFTCSAAHNVNYNLTHLSNVS